MQSITGLVLAGGKSSRMGTDKAWINYHGAPQIVHVAQLLKPLCRRVITSYNGTQWPEGVKPVRDDPGLGDIGPMAGLLTVFRRYPDHPILVAGIDYPSLTAEELGLLLESRAPDSFTVAYRHPESGLIEPLIALYEPQCLYELENAYFRGQTSLRKFIASLPHTLLDPVNTRFLESADTPDQAKAAGLTNDRKLSANE